MKALKDLCSRQLYKYENICINTNWDQILESNNEEMMQYRNNNSESEAIELEIENPTETLVHRFIESHRIHDLQDRIFKVTLVEGQKPLAIFNEKFSEVMNFTILFFGNPCDDDNTERLIYQKIVQWELQHFSGDFSYHIIFFLL